MVEQVLKEVTGEIEIVKYNNKFSREAKRFRRNLTKAYRRRN